MTDDAAAALPDVSRETLEKLKVYAAALRKWNPKINLVASKSLDELWTRHMADSAQLWALKPAGAGTWIDLGSGGGFPGLVIAAIASEEDPDLKVSLVESDQRKCVFLREAAREMGVGVEIMGARIESLSGRSFDVISARALAPLDRLLELAEPIRADGGVCLFLKGARAGIELTDAARTWHIGSRMVTSRIDPNSHIIEIREFSRV